MKIITETYQSTEPVTKTIERIQTTDGRMFCMNEGKLAKKHQEELDEMEAFKKTINYKEVDLPYFRFRYARVVVFTFELSETLLEKENRSSTFSQLKKLTGLFGERSFYNVLYNAKPGKYVVIEHREEADNPNGSDYSFYDGFFGTVSEYFEFLDREIKTAEANYADAKTLLNQ